MFVAVVGALISTLVLVFVLQAVKRPKIPSQSFEDLVKALQVFKAQLNANQNWTLSSIEPGVRIWTKNNGESFKCEVVINAPFEIVTRVLEFPVLEMEWNPLVEKVQVIHQEKQPDFRLDVLNVTHRRISGIFGFLFLRRIFTLAKVQEIGKLDDECYILLQSVTWAGEEKGALPQAKSAVNQSGFKIKRVDTSSSHVTFCFSQSLGLNMAFEGVYSKATANTTALGLKEFFAHSTLSEISNKVYELSKNEPQMTKKESTKENAGSARNKWILQGKKSVERLVQATSDSSGWTVIGETNQVLIKTKKYDESGIAAVLGEGKINAPPRAVLDTGRNLKDKEQFDPMFGEGRVVEAFSAHCSIIYQAYKPVWPTTGRDFVCLEYWSKLPDGTVVQAVTEATHDQCPEKSGLVRASIILAGFVIKPAPDLKSCDIIYYAVSDLKGGLPQNIVNKATQKNPLVIDGIRRYLQKQDLSQYTGKETVENEPETELPPLEQKGTTDKKELVASPSSPSRDIPLPSHLAGIIHNTMDDILRDAFPEPSESKWTFLETKHDITISRRVNSNSPIHSFKGEGVINRPIEEVVDFIQDFNNRIKYDYMCKKIHQINRYNSRTSTFYTLHAAKQCILKTERDFVFFTHYEVREDKHLIVAKSIEDKRFPPNPDITRAELLSSGWVLIPRGKITLVTYIIQIDLKGKIPTTVINVVSTKQPLCIHYLREAMDGRSTSNSSLTDSF